MSMTAASPGGGFGVYVHWPFCRAKCPYCDFNSHVREGVDHKRWAAALVRELEHFAALVPARRVESVFFGGGTPTLMAPETAGRVLEAVHRLWPVAGDAEVTIEGNPTSVEGARLAAFRDAGVNRVSLGVQALDDAALAFLGREHSAAEALRAVETAAALYLRRSFDLIYCRPGQTVDAWLAELDRALAWAGDHISVYQLTIEPGTAFHHRHRRGEFRMPDEDTAAALYEATQDRLAAAGLPAYEISNHARPGSECRHNLIYWRGGEWIGVGPGAHGRFVTDGMRQAVRQLPLPERWLEAVERDGHGTRDTDAVAPVEAGVEMLMMGLRLVEGVDLRHLRGVTGLDPDELMDPAELTLLERHGMLATDRDAGRLRATDNGRQCLDAVLARLVRAAAT